MYPISDAAAYALTTSHTAPVVVSLWNASLGPEPIVLYPVDGEVTVDSRRAIRRQLSMTLIDDGTVYDNGKTITPIDPAVDPLGIFAASVVRVYRGVRTADVDELIPIGVFTPTTVEVQETDSGPQLQVTGDDLSVLLMRPWGGRQWVIPAGTNGKTALDELLDFNGVESPDVETTSFTTPQITFGTDAESGLWQDALLLAQALGMDLGMLADGTVRAREFADPNDPAVMELKTQTGGVIVDGPTVTYSTDAVINQVKVNVQNTATDTPLSAVASASAGSSLDPDGVWGQRTAEIDNSLIVSQAQADQVASKLLSSVIGTTVELGIIPQPHLDVEDVVAVVAPDVGVNLRGVVDSLTVPRRPRRPRPPRRPRGGWWIR